MAAIAILNRAFRDCVKDLRTGEALFAGQTQVLLHAIRHLAYPDRDTYPKVRGATKGAPIVRRIE